MATPPVLEGIPKGPSSQKSTPQPHHGFHPAQAHPQLPKTKFSCFVGPSVPEPGRVKRSEASWGAKESGVNQAHRLQTPAEPLLHKPRSQGPSPTANFRSYLNPYLLLPHSLGAYHVSHTG